MALLTLSLLALLASGSPAAMEPLRPVKIVFVGDSLTEGYGLSPEQAYPRLLEKSLAPKVEIVNASVSGSTAASAPSRIRWLLKNSVDWFVLALGANDALRGIPPAETERHLREAIRAAKSKGANVLLAGMKAPPNYGPAFRRDFEAIFPLLSKTEKVPLVPFLLEGVGGVPALNQADGIHPNAEGQKKMAQTVAAVLEPLL